MIIDKPKAIELLERAVAEKGADYVDPNSGPEGGCTYQSKGCPACIVGHAYHFAGATLADLISMDVSDPLQGEDEFPVETTGGAARVFFEAQMVQDAGGTWGTALEVAKEA